MIALTEVGREGMANFIKKPNPKPYTSFQIKVSLLNKTRIPYPVKNPEHALKFWKNHIEKKDWFDPEKECLVAMIFNIKQMIKGYYIVSIGDICSTHFHPREILRPAVAANAYSLIVMHNHPSGCPEPSQQDIAATESLAKAADILQIKLLDHIIIGDTNSRPPKFTSLNQIGVIPWNIHPKQKPKQKNSI